MKKFLCFTIGIFLLIGSVSSQCINTSPSTISAVVDNTIHHYYLTFQNAGLSDNGQYALEYQFYYDGEPIPEDSLGLYIDKDTSHIATKFMSNSFTGAYIASSHGFFPSEPLSLFINLSTNSLNYFYGRYLKWKNNNGSNREQIRFSIKWLRTGNYTIEIKLVEMTGGTQNYTMNFNGSVPMGGSNATTTGNVITSTAFVTTKVLSDTIIYICYDELPYTQGDRTWTAPGTSGAEWDTPDVNGVRGWQQSVQFITDNNDDDIPCNINRLDSTQNIRVCLYPEVSAAISASGHNTTICQQTSAGYALIDITSGKAPFSIQPIKNGQNYGEPIEALQSGQNIRVGGLSEGTYTFLVTDANGCSSLTPTSIIIADAQQDNVISLTATPTHVTCYGGNNGSVSTSREVTTGVQATPYIYEWSNQQSGEDVTNITGLTAGNYSVTVTDNMGCTATASVTVTQAAAITSQVEVSCCNYDLPYHFDQQHADTVFTEAGTKEVKYTSANGCDSIVSVTLTVNTPSVTLSDITGTGTICAGSEATLSVGAIADGTEGTVSYAWSNNRTQETWNTASISVSPSDTTLYTVVATATIGEGDDACTATDTKSFTVKVNAPAVVLNEISGVSTICYGGETELSISTTTGTKGTVTYVWNTQETTSTITVEPTATANYSVVATATVGEGNEACSVTASKSLTVTVNTPAVTLSGITGTTTICKDPNGQGTILSVEPASNTGTMSYEWSNSRTQDTWSTASITANPSDTTLYTVVATATVSTNNVTCTATDSKSVTVNVNAPAVALNAITPATICQGGSTTLEVSAASHAGNLSYVWNEGNTAIANSNSTTLEVSPTTTTTYIVVATATVGEGDEACTATDTKSVEVTVNAPAVTLNNMTDVTICQGGQGTTLTIEDASRTGTLSYAWSAGNTAIENSNSASINVNPTATTTYTVVVTATVNTNDVPCTATATKSVTVTVNAPAVTISDITGSSTICAGSNTTLSVVPTSNTGTVTYAWTAGEETIGGNNNSITVTPDATTEYTVVATATVNTNDVTCTTTDTKSFEVTVNAPVVALGDIAGTNTICKGNETTLSVEPTSSTGTVTYAWSNQENDNSITVSPTQNTTYIVTATATVNTNNVSCTATDTKSISVTVNAPAITMNAISGDTHFCLGGSTQLTASTQTANGDVTYAWSPATYLNTTEGATVTSTPTAEAEGEITYTVVGTATVNTNDVTCTITDSKQVTLTINDTVKLTASGNLTQRVCQNSEIATVTFSYENATITHTAIPAGLSYTDDEEGTVTISGTPTAAGEFEITITATSDQSNPSCGSKTKKFNLTVDPEVTLSATNLTQSVCAGSSISDVEITATNSTVTTSTLPDGLQFDPEDYIITGAPTTANNANNPYYTVTITATSNQDEPIVCQAKELTFTLTVNPTVTLEATNLTQSVCAGSAITDVVITNTNSTVTTSELPEGLTFSNNIIAGTPTTAGTYSITITATSNQSNPTCTSETATFNLTVNPTVTLEATNLTQSVCAGSEITAVEITYANANIPTFTYNIDDESENGLPEGLTFNNNKIIGAPEEPGSYVVTITAESNQTPACATVSQTFNLTINPTVVLEADELTQTVCAGSNITDVELEIEHANTPTFTYTINNENRTGLPTGLSYDQEDEKITGAPTEPGIYTITITATSDQTPACATATLPFNLTVNPTVTLSATNLEQSVCAGSNIADVTITTANANTSTFTYTKDGGNSNTGLPTGLTFSNNKITGTAPTTAGVYVITITATSNQEPACTAETQTFTLTVKALPTPTISSDEALCSNNYLDVTTDANMDDYVWDVNGANYLINNGNYIRVKWTTAGEKSVSVTYTGANGCTGTATKSVTVYATPDFTLTSSVANNSICANEGTDVITVSPAGYQYIWARPGALNATPTGGELEGYTFSSTTPGSYTVNVTGKETHGSLTCQTTQNVTVTVNEQPVLTVTPQNPTCYGGNNGKITTTVTGGTPAYSFDWSNDTHSNNAQNLTAGTYSVTVTDAKGCHAYADEITLTSPTQVTASASDIIHVTCNGGNDGAFTVTGQGGTTYSGGRYLYILDNDENGELAVAKTFTGLTAGEHTVNVSDQNGCPADVVSVIITEPAILTAGTINGSASTLCYNTGTTLTGGTEAAGGNGTITYQWQMLDGNTWTNLDNATNAASCSTGNLTATTQFRRAATNNCGTVYTDPVTVEVYPALAASDITGGTAGICIGETHNLSVTVTSGSSDYSYEWEMAESATSEEWEEVPENGNAATYAASIADPGTTYYRVIITDNCGNHQLTKGPVQVTVWEELDVEDLTDQTVCKDAEVTLTATSTGGNGQYTYAWKQSANGTDWSDATGTNNEASYTPSTAAASSATTYKVVVTDNCNNSIEKSATITVYSLPVVNAGEDVNICVGATTTLTASAESGKAPYTYQWFNGNTALSGNTANDIAYTTPAVDATAGANTTYKVVVTDACSNTNNDEVVVSVNAALTLTKVDSANITCHGASTGWVEVTAANGALNYQYKIDNGTYGEATASATATFENLAAGSHTVTVRDNCETEESVTFVLTEPEELALAVTDHSDLTCNGNSTGSITVTASNGTANYQYKIDNETYGEATAETTVTFSNLAAGEHTVTVKDNCGVEKTASYTLTEPDVLSLTESTNDHHNVSCYNGTNGSVTVNVTGGTATYQYKVGLNGTYGEATAETSFTYANRPAEKDTLYVKDANGCEANVPVEITQPNELELTEVGDDHIDLRCFGDSDGEITVTAIGGTGTYTYKWDDNAYTGNAHKNDLVGGEHTIVVKDENNCTDTLRVTIQEPAELTIANISSSNISCYGLSDGTISITMAGGTQPYTYSWSDDSNGNYSTSASRTHLPSDTYYVTVSDAYYCLANISLELTDPGEFTATISIANNDNEICAYETTSFTAETTGSIASLQWQKDGENIENATSSTLSNVNTAGSYTVVATQTTSGCTVTSNAITLIVDTVPNVTITGHASVCDGENFELTAHNANHYVWSDGTHPIETLEEDTLVANGEDIDESTTYYVTGTNSYGCTASAEYTVTVNPLPSTDLTIIVNGEDIGATGEGDEVLLCEGGSVTISVPYVESNTYIWYKDGEEEEEWHVEVGHTNTLELSNITEEETGSYYVIVTDANECEGWMEPVYVSVVPLPNFTLSVNDETEGISMCADGTVAIYASGSSVQEVYPYSWEGDYLSGNSNTWHTFGPAPAGNHTIFVTAINAVYGFVSDEITDDEEPILVCSKTESIGITVYALPTVTLASSPAATDGEVAICDGQTATLTATSETNSFSWEKDRVSMEGSSNILEVTEEGKYTVSVTDGNGCSNTSDTITVYVNPLPDFTIGSETEYDEGDEDGIEVCRGTEVDLYAEQESEEEIYNYSWQTDEYLESNDGEATFLSTAPAGTYTISATATNATTGCTQSRSYTIIVHELPTITVADAQVCLNGTVALSASGADEYEWTPASYFMAPNTVTDVVTGASVTFYGTEAGEKEINITGTDEYGCVNETTATVTVLELPTTGLTLANKEICQGASTSWTIENGNYTNYVWASSSEDALTADGATATFTSSTTGTHSVTVTVTDNNNCTNSSSAEVMVHALPTPTLSSDNAVCEGNTITFTTDIANADNGIHDYIWTYPETNATVEGETTGNTLTLSWSDNGSKTVTVNYTDGNGCTATQAASRSITVNALPDVVITNGQSAAICLGGTVNLNAVGATSYVWENEAGNTAAITVEPERDSTFTVTGTDDNGCSNTAAINITVYDTVKLTATNATQTLCLGTAIEPIALTIANCTLDFGQMSSELTYNETNNTITGELTTAGVHSFTITATSEHGCSSKSLPVFITMNDTVKLTADNTTQTLCLGTAIEPIALTIANCELDFGQMPTNDLTYDESDHIITGEVSSAGEHIFTITASSTTCPSTEKSVEVSITMNDTARLVATNTTQELCLGEAIDDIVLDTAHCTLDFGQMPSSLTYNAGEHKIKGELEQAGTYTFTITASNNCGNKTQEVSITMLDTAKLTATNTTQTFCLGTPITAIMLDTANCELDFGQMPTGLSYNETAHQIEGEILTAGVHNFTVTATSDCGEKSVDITITMNDTAHFEADNLTQTLCLGTNITPIVLDTAHCTLDFGSMSNELSYNAAAHQIEGRLTTAGTHEFTITATAGNNCGSKTQNVSITMNDTVKLVALSPADNFSQKFCQGNEMTALNFRITNSDDVELTGAPAGVTLEAVTATSATDPNYVMSGTPTQTGTFNFTITASSEACEASVKTLTGTIVVDTIPAVTITTDAVNNTVCAGETITLTATEGYEEYTWNAEGEEYIFETEPDRTEYTVTVTNGENCSNTATINITINALPTVTISEENSLSTICADSAFHFVVNCATAVEYLWSDESSESTLRATDAGTYSVIVTDENGCSKESNTLTVNVNELPEVETEHENVSCTELGSAIITVTTGIGEYTCTWDGGTPEEMTIMADLPTLIINELSEGTYTYVVTDLNNCSTTGTVTIENPGFITGTQSILSDIAEAGICKGSDNIVTFTIDGGTPDYSIEWVNVSNGEVVAETDEVSSTPATFNLNELAAGDYLLAMVITDVFGCTGIAADTIALTVWPTYNIVREINIGTGLNEYTYGEQTYAITNGIPEVPETEELETAHGCDSIISYVVNQYDLEILFADTCIMTRSSYTREYTNTPNELLGDTIYLAKNTPSYFYAYLSNTTENTWNGEKMDMSYELQYSEQPISEDDMPNLVENFSISTYYDRVGVYYGVAELTEPTGEIPSTTFAFRQTANSTIMQFDYFYFEAFKNIPNKVTFTGLENGTYTLKLKAELRNSVEETGIDRNGIYNPYIVNRRYGHILGGYGDTIGQKEVIAARNLTIIVNEDGVNPAGAPAAISEYSSEASVQSFPNPVNDQLNLVIHGMEGNTQITITDAQGKVVRVINAELTGGTEVLTYSVSDFAQGIYFLNVRNSEKVISQKFVVTRR